MNKMKNTKKREEMSTFSVSQDELAFLREKVTYYMIDQDYENSVFWAEKVFSLIFILF